MEKVFNLEVLTPERPFFEGEAVSLTVTTTDGQFTFLAGHAPIVMPVVVGSIVIKTPEGQTIEAFNSEGFLELGHELTSVYLQACERPEDIDRLRAEEAKRRAEERLRQRQSMSEYTQNKMALARAMARLSVSAKYRRR
ncbi:MAG TPA: ATP synthase F1 subunit epsilon [Papillibacter sp.]|jgi:F-type H+-transporting ATPase subunit epsilon|nr:ATP synthase F1 subunit epsilon [Papillibacter sp.]